MKIVFFGTPDYVLPILDEVNKTFKGKLGESPIVAVVTQPARPVGRQKLLKFSPVDTWAHKRNIPKYFDPMDLITNNVKADLGILASYGQIIPREVINLFTSGILVIHPSLLPKFRGSSPVPAAIISDTNPTGVTIFKMDEKIDHGPIIAQFKEEVLPADTYESLRDRLFALSIPALIKLIDPYIKNKIKPRVQDETQATYTKTLKKEDGYLDINKTQPEEAMRLYKAMQPWPGIWTLVDKDKRLKIHKLHLEKGKIVPDEVQLEGKNKVTWKQFCEAYPQLILK